MARHQDGFGPEASTQICSWDFEDRDLMHAKVRCAFDDAPSLRS